MARDLAPQLRYLGVIPQTGHLEYGFQIEDKDKTVRLVVLEIQAAFFEKKDLMFQEAPDLCYQKVLSDLSKETAESPMGAHVPITAMDVACYRRMHPTSKQRRPMKKDQKL